MAYIEADPSTLAGRYFDRLEEETELWETAIEDIKARRGQEWAREISELFDDIVSDFYREFGDERAEEFKDIVKEIIEDELREI